MQKYVILKDRNRTPSPAYKLGAMTLGFPSGLSLGHTLDSPPEPSIETHTLSAAEAKSEVRNPETVEIAAVMPTKLIRPIDLDLVPTAPAPQASSSHTWGVEAVKAHNSPFNGSDVTVAVLDTGIDKNHPAFAAVALEEKDFSGSGNGDIDGHGTHCAGTIFGRDINDKRIGVARGVNRALIGKVLADDGGGSSEMLFDGMNWAVERGANIISMSLGFDFPRFVASLIDSGVPSDIATSIGLEGYRANLRMFDAIMDMFRSLASFGRGVVVVAAAGNETRRNIDPYFEVGASVPAAAFGVISVGALQQSGEALRIANFSNTNPTLSAPGVNVLSARSGGGLVPLNGTSMACPHVAGVAALWWEKMAKNSPAPSIAGTVKAKLTANSRLDVISPETDVNDRGAGVVTAPLN